MKEKERKRRSCSSERKLHERFFELSLFLSFQALLYKKYTTANDVWSYGMVLFEIWSVGCKPFHNLSNSAVISLANTGHCQPPPPGCPRAIYTLMVECW